LNVISWWASRYEEPIFLVTNLHNAYQDCRYYRRRYRIETFFSDQKSRGVVSLLRAVSISKGEKSAVL
jgi:hypothetical protein